MAIELMLACFVTPLFAGLYWRRATREGALASMILGLVGTFAFSYYAKFIAPMPMHPSMYGFVISVALMIVVSLATAKPSKKLLDETRTGMFIRGEGEKPGPELATVEKTQNGQVASCPAAGRTFARAKR